MYKFYRLEPFKDLLAGPLSCRIEKKIAFGRQVGEKAHAQRKTAGIKVRQPLSALYVHYKNWQGKDNLLDLIRDEVNVKQVEVTKDTEELEVTLDTVWTDELKMEGKARELIRLIQDLRKEKSLRVDERIKIQLPKEFNKLPTNLLEDVKRKTLVESVVWGDEFLLLNG